MNNIFIKKVLKALKKILKKRNKLVSLHEPQFIGNEYAYLKECIDSNFVSTVGKFVGLFEEKLKKLTKSKNAIALVNGTCALHIGLKILGVKKNDEVLIPSLTFVGPTNAAIYCGAKPHFIDSEYETFGVDALKLKNYLLKNATLKNGKCINKKTNRTIKALIVVHIFGHPSNMDEIKKVADNFNIPILEDAAEGIGSFYKKRHVGTIGKIGVISFNGNKTITTGGGGVILTNDNKIAKIAKHITTTAKIPHRWEYNFDEVGYNYRMPNINAALGIAQLENLSKLLLSKRKLFNAYEKVFEFVDGVSLKKEPKGSKSNYWLQTLVIDKKNKKYRDVLLKITNENNIMTRPSWRPMHYLNHFKKFPRMDLTVAEDLYSRIINIPSSSNIIR